MTLLEPMNAETEKQARIEVLLTQRNAYLLLIKSLEIQLRLLGWVPREERKKS